MHAASYVKIGVDLCLYWEFVLEALTSLKCCGIELEVVVCRSSDSQFNRVDYCSCYDIEGYLSLLR